MSNKEAVNWLINVMADIGKAEHSDLWHYEQALMEIREKLESQPEPYEEDGELDFVQEHKKLPIVLETHTIEPERKRGKWKIYVISMFDGEGCKCSECGFEGAPYWDYCPGCGAIMEGAEQE